MVMMIVMAPFVALGVVNVAVANAEGYRGLLEKPWMVRLGDWSYPAYLFHVPLLLALAPPLRRTSSLWWGWAQLSVYVALVVLISGLVHTRFLTPLERLLKRRWLPARRGD
jgi:peptidoglycan/LPS O-acetylase OafA/YrhL